MCGYRSALHWIMLPSTFFGGLAQGWTHHKSIIIHAELSFILHIHTHILILPTSQNILLFQPHQSTELLCPNPTWPSAHSHNKTLIHLFFFCSLSWLSYLPAMCEHHFWVLPSKNALWHLRPSILVGVCGWWSCYGGHNHLLNACSVVRLYDVSHWSLQHLCVMGIMIPTVLVAVMKWMPILGQALYLVSYKSKLIKL